MNRKVIAMLMIVCLALSSVAVAFAQSTGADMTAMDKLGATETVYYGSEQTGSLIDRTVKLEKDIYGAVNKDAIMDRIDRLYNYTNVSSPGSPSFLLKLNAAEWNLMHNVTTDPAKTRLENLEKTLSGSPYVGSFDMRITRLLHLAFTDGQVDVTQSSLAQDSLVKVKLLNQLSSKDSRAGDSFTFIASEDIFDNGVLIIPKGALGHGTVKAVDHAGNIGQDGKLLTSFDTLMGVDGTPIEVTLGDKAKQKTNTAAKVAGASVAGAILLGPIGLIGGAFVHGEDHVLTAGTELYIQTKSDTQLYGIRTK